MAEEDFECPVCFLLPEKEVYQCGSGHVLCHKCSAIHQQCPQCRVSIAGGRKYRNLFMEKTLDKLQIDCEFKDKGCDKKLKRGEVAAHKTSCEFGKTLPICKLLGFECDFKIGRGSLNKITPHLNTSHGKLSVIGGNQGMLYLKNFFLGKGGIFKRPIEFDMPRDKILFVGHVKDGYVSWLCFDLSEVRTLGLKIKISLLDIPSISWEVPLLPIMDAEKYFNNPPNKIHIPFLDMLRKEENPGVQHKNLQLIFS